MTLFTVYKNLGETPLECLERLRQNKDLSADLPMTYAGRLDPMAEGLLIILTGEDCKNKEKYLNLDKEYELEILFGVFTDSYDGLGIIEKINPDKSVEINFNKYIGKFEQEYPRYSSRIISMKELPDEMPTREVEIYSIEQLNSGEVEGQKIAEEIIQDIRLVMGNFRQEKIIEKWRKFSEDYGEQKFKIIKIRVNCSSGTYMRSLANKMGGLAISIKRTKIGNYSLCDIM